MASSIASFLFTNVLSLFIFLSVVTFAENTTSYSFNTTVFTDGNRTNDTTTQLTPSSTEEPGTTSLPPEPGPTSLPPEPGPTSLRPEPGPTSLPPEPGPTSLPPEPGPTSLPPEPLPVSGHLLIPVSDVDRLCPCDEHLDVCDISCCCDRDCRDDVSLFTSCSLQTVSGNEQLCSRDVASYSLRHRIDGFSEVDSSVRKEISYDMLCIQSQNRVDGFSHPSPTLPTDGNFDSLFETFAGFLFGSEEDGAELSAAEPGASSGYQYGDVMVTAAQDGQSGTFMLPAPGLTADCVANSPAAFLKDRSSRCSQQLVLDQDCSGLPVLRMETFTNIRLLSGKSPDAALVPVEVTSVVLQSVDGTQSELQMSGGETLTPVLLKPTLCAHVVLKVVYTMRYNPAGEILNAAASLLLGFVNEAASTLEQEFHITFVQEDQEAAAVHYSGNPGYVFGLPLVSGTKTADGMSRSIDPGDTLSLLHSAQDQDCLRGRHQRSPVLFGLDYVSGCTLRLEDAANCSQVHRVLLDLLRGPNYPQYVASFGNSPLDSPLDWVPIQSGVKAADAQSCSIPLSLHLEVQWTRYGSLVNPQARIVHVKEVVQTNSSSLVLLSAGSSFLSVSTSVSFTPVSAPALPGYRATPTINAKLPFDFFFPFV